MRNSKVDPQVVALQRRVSNAQNHQVLHFSLTVGKRIICHKAVTPSKTSEYLRLRSNRGLEEGVDAVTATIDNSEGCVGSLSLDGKLLHYDTAQFGRDIDYAWLRINNRPTVKIYSTEGIKAITG